MDDHAALLDALAAAEPGALMALGEAVLPDLGEVEVIRSRTGLVMLPMRDTVRGTAFHLGEVLVAEAHIRAAGAEGYGVVTGRDLERSMAMAVLDAAVAAGIRAAEIRAFAEAQAARRGEEDDAVLRRVEATRVEMETF